MSGKSLTRRHLGGVDFSRYSKGDLAALFLEILKKRIHGVSFSVYSEEQAPGSQVGEEQIRERMEIIEPYVKWIRSFSCTDGLEEIPRIAHEYGIKTLVGAWLGDDQEKNEREIEGLIRVAKAGFVNIAAVGNEVLLRGDLTEDQIIEYIDRFRKAVPDVPVGYVDAYFEFEVHPRISEASDIILANCYPFWEGYAFEHAHLYLKEMYQAALRAGQGKKVIITETGWPNLGSPDRVAVPSYENAIRYFINTYQWAAEAGIDIFYFSSFDETWKIDAEGDVGAYWGIWDKDGDLKYCQ